jgi:hypothetical protein
VTAHNLAERNHFLKLTELCRSPADTFSSLRPRGGGRFFAVSEIHRRPPHLTDRKPNPLRRPSAESGNGNSARESRL